LERLLIEKKIIPLDEITPGQANVYRWQHVCGEVFVKPFSRIATIYCPKCHVSQGQGELYEFIRSLYEGEIVINDRAAIAPKEIDIYLPALKLGFEFNGKYWHKGDGSRELEKSSDCKESGIMLLHVWETEWNKERAKVKAQVESAIRSRMAN
jgi:very-short-patch-repair endonuclease